MNHHDRRSFLKGSLMALAASEVSGSSILARAWRESVTDQQSPFFSQTEPNPEVIAHRGGDGHWPGETMYAMRRAKEIGADVLEMDVYLTKDDHLVLMHDVRTSKTTESHALINSLKLEEVQKLSAAYNWSKPQNPLHGKKFGELPNELKNVLRVPSLREIFEALPQMRMVIEMKPAVKSPAAALSDLIREYRVHDKVLVASFSHTYLKDFRTREKDVATSASALELVRYLVHKETPKASAIQITPEITASISNAFKVELPVLTPQLVERAHDDKLKVHAWTINDSQAMDRMIKMEVDGIITDYPCRLLEQLHRRPTESPPCVFSPS
jgi:glycerophosphoryl diester phosphodiesterase